MKTLAKYAGGGLLVLAALGLILGNDLLPWLKTARNTAADQLLGLVDQYELKLQRVQQKIDQYEQTVYDQAKQRSRLKSLVDRLDNNLDESRAAVKANRGKLQSLQARLVRDGVVFTSTGQPMPSAEIEAAIERSNRQIKFAQQRIDSLESMHTSCGRQLASLDKACELAPAKIASLETYCRDLRDKISLAREMQQWTEETRLAKASTTTNPRQIEQSLEAIDADIESEIAGLTALLSIQSAGEAPQVEIPTEDLILKIESALGSGPKGDALAEL